MTEKEIAEHLAWFFEKEPEKITLWWFTENPGIGGEQPAMYYLLRPKKFEKWFKNLKESNVV